MWNLSIFNSIKKIPKSSYQLVETYNWKVLQGAHRRTVGIDTMSPLSRIQWPCIAISISIKRYCCGQAWDLPVCVCMRITLSWNDTCDNANAHTYSLNKKSNTHNMQCMYECNRRLRSMLNAMHNKNTVRAFQRNNIFCYISFPAKPSPRGDLTFNIVWNTSRHRSQHAIKSRIRWNQFICLKLNSNSSLRLYRRLKRVKYQYLRSTNR